MKNDVEFDFSRLKQELKIRGYSKRTGEVYLYYNQQFLKYCNRNPLKVNSQDVRNYLEYLINCKKSRATVRLAHNSLQFYYTQILKRRLMVNITLPKREKKTIVTLTKDEINALISVIKNPKHRLLIEFIYASGLRVSEVVRFRISDLFLDEGLALVRAGKGNKERKVILSKRFIEDFSKYFSEYEMIKGGKIRALKSEDESTHLSHLKPKKCRDKEDNSYLFPGRTGHLTIRSVQAILKTAAAKAKIKKRVYPHLLRHSFATHLLNNAVDLKYIQKLLGHQSIRTTQVYLHVNDYNLKKINSPFDD